MNTPHGNSITTAEHTIAMIMSLARQIPDANVSTKNGKWEKSKFVGTEITGKKLGLIGCGNIGSIVVDRAKGLKMRGFTAWFAWLFIHLLYLVEFQDRVLVFFRWVWSYLTWHWGVRIIFAAGSPPEHSSAPGDEAGSEEPPLPSEQRHETPAG